MRMFSLSEEPQQSAPTVVALAAAAPAAEAVTGTRVFPPASSKGVAEASASSAGAALAAVPAAAPATGGTVFPTASVWGAARAPAFADGIAALTAAPATGGTVLFAASVGGAPALSAVAATSEEISAAEPATSGTVPSAASIRGQSGGAGHPLERYHRTRKLRRHRRPAVLLPMLRRWRGWLESSRQQLGPLVKSAARGGDPPTPLIPVSCFRWRSATAATGKQNTPAAAAAAAATTSPATTTPGGMQLVLEYYYDPLIRGNDAG